MKKLFTMLIISCLLFAVGFGDVSRASGNEITPEAFIQSEDPLVDSEEMIDSLAEAASAFALVEAYAQNATQQTQVVFEQIDQISIELGLVQSLETHLEDVNQSAKTWLDELKPQLQQTTQNIITFTNTFEVFTEPLRQAIEKDTPDEFLMGIEILLKDIEKYDLQTESLVEDLTVYRDELTEIVGSLNSDFEKIQMHLEGEDGTLAFLKSELDLLSQQLAALQAQIILLGTMVGAAPIGIHLGLIFIAMPMIGPPLFVTSIVSLGVGIPSLIDAIEAQNKVTQEIQDKTKELGQIESEYAVFSQMNENVGITKEFAEDAWRGTQSLKDSWGTMKTKFNNLREQVENLDWEYGEFWLPPLIDSTEREAQDINEYAKHLQLEYEVIIEEIEEPEE